MKHFAAAAALFVATLFSAEAGAVASKTFVSATGSDANTSANCSTNQPCRTFSAAYSVTSAGGHIIALSTGVYGQLTITTAVTISAAFGVTAIIQVPQNQTGFTVAAGAGDNVVLRNLTVYGTNTGTKGVNHTTGKLILDHMTFSGLEVGFETTGKSDVIYSSFWDNDVGAAVSGEGCPNSGNPILCTTAVIRLRGGEFLNNALALKSTNPGADKTNIFGFHDGGQGTNFAGNSDFLTCTGTGCPFFNPTTYTSGNVNPH
jgi:hypothetical protein